MVDHEVVLRRLREIDRRVVSLRSSKANDRVAFSEDLDLQAQVERHLQVAIQAAIDVAIHILADDTGDTPDDYGSAFVLLARHTALPQRLADRLRLAAGFRNVLVHAYVDIDAEQVWKHLNDVQDLTEFAEHIVAYLSDGVGG